MLVTKINDQIREAMKAHETVRLETLRMLSAALTYAQIDKMRELTEPEELEVIRKEAKKRQDAIEAYNAASAFDRAAREKQEFEVLQEYLPTALSDEELSKIIEASIATVGRDFGAVMKAVMAKTDGRADGKVVSENVRAKLQ